MPKLPGTLESLSIMMGTYRSKDPHFETHIFKLGGPVRNARPEEGKNFLWHLLLSELFPCMLRVPPMLELLRDAHGTL